MTELASLGLVGVSRAKTLEYAFEVVIKTVAVQEATTRTRRYELRVTHSKRKELIVWPDHIPCRDSTRAICAFTLSES